MITLYRDGDGKFRPRSLKETLKGVALVSLSIGLTLGVVKLGNHFLAPHEVKAAEVVPEVVPEVSEDCFTDLDGVHCFGPGVKNKLAKLALAGGVKWYTEKDGEVYKNTEKYSKQYPIASRGIIQTIIQVAQDQNYGDLDYLMKLINCESKFDPKNVNGTGNSPATSKDRGLLQFSSYWQKKVSDSCAFDATCSLKTAIPMLKAGQNSLWACHKIITK